MGDFLVKYFIKYEALKIYTHANWSFLRLFLYRRINKQSSLCSLGGFKVHSIGLVLAGTLTFEAEGLILNIS